MIAVVQRVKSAQVTVHGEVVGRVERGLCALASVVKEDTDADLQWMVDKLIALRVFPDGDKEFDVDLRRIGGSLLLVSNFTVSAACKRGRRPSFEPAMPPAMASVTFARFVEMARASGVQVQTGRFAADMIVNIENDGPVTLILDSRAED